MYHLIYGIMKALYTPALATGVIMALSGCSGMRLSNSNALADDVYYDGDASTRIATAPKPSGVNVTPGDIASYDARVSSYRSASSGVSSPGDSRDFSQIQQYYANSGSLGSSNASDSLAQNKVLVAQETTSGDYDASGGYWVDGFYGSDADQSYAERIVRFHRPLVSVNYYSPFFTAARFSGDWNIYVDDYGSSYLVPTWTNPWYSDYYYGSGIAFDWYWGRASWRFGWGWSGWYHGWDFGWGYPGWGYAWGWPHHHCGWGWGDHWHHHPHYGHWGAPGADYRRPTYAARSTTSPRSYSGGRQRAQTVTTNPNGERAAQHYRDAVRAERRSYTRSLDGRSTSDVRLSYGSASNYRRSGVSSESSRSENGTRVQHSANVRRSDAVGAGYAQSNVRNSSRSSYTPSRASSRSSSYAPSSSSSRSSSYSNSNNSRRGSSSSYSPSGRSSSYSSGSSRSSSSSRSYSSSRSSSRSSSSSSFSRGSSHSSGSFSGGRSGGFSGGGSRSGGGSQGGGRSR